MNLIRNAMVFDCNGNFNKSDVLFDDKIRKIGIIGKSGGIDGITIDAAGCLLIPGLIDIHTHGAMGADTCDADIEGLRRMSGFYAANGVTSFCAATMTLGEDSLAAAMETAGSFNHEGGAKLAGIYMEGPFISESKKGAQAAVNIAAPDVEMFRRLNKKAGGKVRVVTVAPELPGAMEFIREISGVCRISLAHSAADYYIAMEAFESGAAHVTHLFNAMDPFLHRAPGIVGAAADTEKAIVELICDGIHIHPAVIRAAFRLFGEGRICLISDSMRCAGLSDGDYDLGGQEVFVRDGKAALKDGTIAGSSINVMTAVKMAVEFGIKPEAALKSAAFIPAKAIGMADSTGRIAEGYCADLVLLDKDWNIIKVFIDGEAL
ncbi:MAG: N-acetylglucosamine-6-phosphate deacetylase [Eubacteriales bacterium]|nr:N-acetylglucosamine-6-phosphate deacetylase [Eubacteriales bacterium]